jgi:hypothetical protein
MLQEGRCFPHKVGQDDLIAGGRHAGTARAAGTMPLSIFSCHTWLPLLRLT